MSEITKLYKKAGVKPFKTCEFCTQRSVDCMKENISNITCGFSSDIFPPFTAEKQIELIKWLSDTDYYIHNIYKTIDTKEYFIENYYYDMQVDNFEESLAGLVNNLWQDLTEEEQAEIKKILE